MATTTNFGWETPDDTDLVKDGASAIRTLGQAIDTSMADLEGGTTGQVLSKASNTDMDFTWVTPDDANAIQNAIVDAKGDLIAATAADTPARLPVGTNGQVLTADSTASTGLAWTTPSSGAGLVLINSTSFTASTAVNVDSVFSSTYRNYRIVASFVESSASDYSLRVRSGGTSYTTAKYEGRGWTNGGSLTGVTYNSSTAWIVGSQGTSAAGFSLDIYAPNITGYLTFTSTAVGLSSGSAATGSSVNGWIDATTVADGFQIFPASGTITGVVKVYGYAN